MIGSSIYLRDRTAFTGGSPQAVYEELWQQGRKGRLRTRAILSGATLILCSLLVNAVLGLVMALLVAAADTYFHWRGYNACRVWRLGLRGDQRMNRLLRFTLERRGHRVLHARTVPGQAVIDQLLVGPGGVWLIHNEAWHPEAEITQHGGKVFIDGRTQSALVRQLTGAAASASRLLSDRTGLRVQVMPLLAVHGGQLTRSPFTADGIVFARPLRLLRWARRHPDAEFTASEVELIAQAAVHTLPIGGRTMSPAA
ncbi:nuclease-related domain-containing protein [Spirillospora sp. NPDC048911]|uniref:nuclease-related domain-containing protein n=1 Tax=Spirillospora sp. NPDC048911 TaxID=3364527 RepID=UPI003720CD7C